MVPAFVSILYFVNKPLRDMSWQYVPSGGVTLMSVFTFVRDFGGRVMSTALQMS